MDSGCLIDFETLKEGDEVFHITKGKVVVIEIDEEKRNETYVIQCSTLNEDGFNDTWSFDKKGREFKDDVYPTIYKKDPFKFAFGLVKEHRNEVYKSNQENNKLWTANQSMKKEIKMLRQAKVV
jgi:hypothetical protein